MSVTAVRTFTKGQPIYAEGDMGGMLPKLCAGAVMLYTLLDDGRRQIIDLAGPGEFLHFDLDGTIDHYAEALTEVQIAFYPAEELMADPDTAQFLIDQMRERLAAERRHITMMSRKSATERLADFVSIAQDCLGAPAGRVTLPLTRQQIADFTGLTLETVSRTFARWEKERRLTKLGGKTYQIEQNLAA